LREAEHADIVRRGRCATRETPAGRAAALGATDPTRGYWNRTCGGLLLALLAEAAEELNLTGVECLAGQLLQFRLLPGGEPRDRLVVRLLAQRLPLLHRLGIAEPAAAGEQLFPVLGQFLVDRLDLVLLLVGDLQRLLDLLVGERLEAAHLELDLLE